MVAVDESIGTTGERVAGTLSISVTKHDYRGGEVIEVAVKARKPLP